MPAASVATATATRSRSEKLVIALLLALLALLALKCAWTCDDAYITFRVVDNLVDGFGPRWNTAERVQAYTNPLWMLLMAAPYAATREPYFTSIALGLALTLAAATWLALTAARDVLGAGLALVVLASSKAFVDYSTSGLENPLLHVALVGTLIAFSASVAPSRRALLLALGASAVALTRLDGLLLVAPVLALHFANHPGAKTLARFALGFAPLVAWELFALVYYGFLLPNTAYAKLSSGLPASELWLQGASYFADSLRRDPLTLLAIGSGLGVALWKRERLPLAIAAGILLHLVYVAKVGGDFMSGRFFTAPLVCAAFVLARAPFGSGAKLLGALATLAIAVASPLSPLRAPLDYSRGLKQLEHIADSGIADERGYWFNLAGLFSSDRGDDAKQHVSKGLAFAQGWRDAGPSVQLSKGIGYLGYWAGPQVHIVDPMGLADALLARQPIVVDGVLVEPKENAFRERKWRIGHFCRHVPEGYLDALRDPTKQLVDPRLERERAELDLITRGPLFSAARWRAIL